MVQKKGEFDKGETMTNGQTAQQLYGDLFLFRHCSVPLDFKTFLGRLYYYSRVGLVPKPTRLPREDGQKGTIGYYPPETLDKLYELFSERQELGKSHEQQRKFGITEHVEHQYTSVEKHGPTTGQKLYRVGFWFPAEVSARVDHQIEAGHPLGKQVLVGTRLMEMASEEARAKIIAPIAQVYGGPRTERWWVLDTRWGTVCALLLADAVLSQLAELAALHERSGDELLSRWRFEIEVVNGEVQITAISPLTTNEHS